MFKGKITIRRISFLVFIIALGLFALSLAGNGSEDNAERVARSAKGRIQDRIGILETYIAKALDNGIDDYSCLEGLPEDMVIYKYVNM